MVKLQVLGNNSKTVNNIKNLTWGKNDQHIKIYLLCNFGELKKGALDSQSQVIKLTSCLPMVDGSLRVLWLRPSLKLVAMI
jgi:hypothetical protein